MNYFLTCVKVKGGVGKNKKKAAPEPKTVEKDDDSFSFEEDSQSESFSFSSDLSSSATDEYTFCLISFFFCIPSSLNHPFSHFLISLSFFYLILSYVSSDSLRTSLRSNLTRRPKKGLLRS